MPAPSVIELAEVKLGLAGLIDRGGSAAFVVMPKADGELPGKAILLPTKDYAKLVEQLNPDDAKKKIAKIELNGKESAITKLGDYAAIAPIVDEAILNNFPRAHGRADKIGAMAGWIKQQDVYAFGHARRHRHGRPTRSSPKWTRRKNNSSSRARNRRRKWWRWHSACMARCLRQRRTN